MVKYTKRAMLLLSVLFFIQLNAGDDTDNNSCAHCPCATTIKNFAADVNNEMRSSRGRMQMMWDRIHYNARYSDIHAAAALTWFAREAHIIQLFAVHVARAGAATMSVLQTTAFSGMAPGIVSASSLVTQLAAYSVPWAGSLAMTTLVGKVVYDLYRFSKLHPPKHKSLLELIGVNGGAFIRSCGRVAVIATVVGYTGSLCAPVS
jgi:hypothetical protein